MPKPPRALLAATFFAAVLGGAWLSPAALLGRDLPELPGPSPRPRASAQDPAEASARCEGCHEDIAAEWRGSLHQEAWHDPVFQSAYQIEPVAFCRGCHAPEADASTEPSVEAQNVGVGCTTCHQQGDEIVGVRDLAASPEHHAVRGDARLATQDACASCHQFDFPRSKGQPMQDTLGEHASSSLSAVACQSCHMPLVETKDGKHRRSHDFAVITDPEMIRRAATAAARRGKDGDVEIEIEAAQVGHAFPTGDMFRRLELRAEALDAEGRVVMRAPSVFLARRFGDVSGAGGAGATRRVEIADTRVPPPGKGTRRAVLRFPAPTTRLSVRWVVAYERMDHAMAASFDVDQARDEIIVARGLIPPSPSTNPKSNPKVSP